MAKQQSITSEPKHDVHLCGQKTFEFRIVYRGGSYDALIGAANTKMNGED